MKSIFITGLCFLMSWSAQADDPRFDDITDADLEAISREFSTMFIHTTMTPATSPSGVGVEFGLIASATKTPTIEAISKRVDPGADIPMLPSGMLYGVVALPVGLTVEANFLPKLDAGPVEASHLGGGVKWSLTESVLPILPFDLGVRTYFSKSEVQFLQTIPGTGQVDVDFENNMFGIEAIAGLTIPVVQPYIGLGYARSGTELTGVATADPTYSLFLDNVSRSKKTSVSGTRLILGLQFDLTLVHLGLEYTRVFDRDRLSTKLAFSF